MIEFNTIKSMVGIEDPTLLDVFKYINKHAPTNQRIIIYGTIVDNWDAKSNLLRLQSLQLINYLIETK